MRIFFLRLLFFFLVSAGQELFGQDISFTRVQSPLGGFSGNVSKVIQDSYGYIWFSTGAGVFRYDGYNFKGFSRTASDSNSLTSSNNEILIADSKGYLWLAPWAELTVDRFNPLTGEVRHFKNRRGDNESLDSGRIRKIFEDRDGYIWFGILGGLNRYDPRTGKFKRFKHNPNDTTTISCNSVREIFQDKQGRIWIGTGSAWPGEDLNIDDGGLNLYHPDTETFTRYMANPADQHCLINNKVTAIFEDSKDNFWIGTAGDGLHKMDRISGKFTRYPYDPGNPQMISRNPVNKSEIVDYITFISEDSAKNLWIGTLASGLSRYDNQTSTNYRYGMTGASEHPTRDIWSFGCTRDGNIWIGTRRGGLYRVDPFRKKIPSFYVGSQVNVIYSTKDGLWLGTSGGLFYKDNKSGSISKFPARNNVVDRSPENMIYAIEQDSEGNLWTGTGNGLYKFDLHSEKFKHYRYDSRDNESIPHDVVSSVKIADTGHLWVGTMNSLSLMDKKTGKFKRFDVDSAEGSIGSQFTHNMLQDKSGNLWIGFNGGSGIDFYDKQKNKFTHYLTRLFVGTIVPDKSGKVWVATSEGLYYAENDKRELIHYDISNNTFRYAVITGLAIDAQDKIWISTVNGITKIDVADSSLITYSTEYGIDGNDISIDASHTGRDGTIYFGNSTGYYYFSPSELKDNSTKPTILLSGINIRGKAVLSNDKMLGDSSVESINTLTLRYDQNAFSFEFACIHYSSSENNRLMYMMEGYDIKWNEGGGKKTAEYFNIPPGDYTFLIKASNGNGIWVEKKIGIHISPPWWKTPWAYALFAVLAGFFIWWLYRLQKARLLRAEHEKARSREIQHAHEIEQAYQELKATQTQLVQQEKMASLGELTAGIAHEIQNPLNFVNNFSDVNRELIDDLNEELDRGNTREVKIIAENLRDNESKINHHGKRADAIVKSMLQHSRASTGQKEPADINALAEEYLRLSYHGLRAKDKSFNSSLQIELDPTIGKINIISQDIGRVFLNLFNNAYYAVSVRQKKYPGTDYLPAVSLYTKRSDDHITISIKDNGGGIPEGIREKIFQPFFTTKPTGEGTGLGLSLAYDIIKAHGGQLQLNTEQDGIAEFVIKLPYA